MPGLKKSDVGVVFTKPGSARFQWRCCLWTGSRRRGKLVTSKGRTNCSTSSRNFHGVAETTIVILTPAFPHHIMKQFRKRRDDHGNQP